MSAVRPTEPSDFLGPAGNSTDKYTSRNPLARHFVEGFLRTIDRAVESASPSSILDVGCGEGVVTERMATRTGARTVGVDIGDAALQSEWRARECARLSFSAASAYDLPFEDGSFDCVCAIELLEHLERPRDALAEMARVTRRALLVSVPSEPLWRVVHLLAGRDVRALGNTPGHINHWSADAFEELIAEYGQVKDVRRPFPWTVVHAELAAPPRAPRPQPAHRTELERVLYFGTYERDYPRNAQVVSCLRRAGVEVTEHHVAVWDDTKHKFGAGAAAGVRLAKAQLELLRRPNVDFDAVIVGYPGHLDMARARRIAGDRPLVFNPLLSLYDSLILDRGRWSDSSPAARVLERIDRRAMRLADLVIADTEAHAEYFSELAGLPRRRIEVCLLGTEERVFKPGWQPSERFQCLFFGKLIPLHGLDTILRAARLAPEVPFKIIGTGQLDGWLEHDRPENVEWTRWVDYEQLPSELYGAGCALGIFGTTEKAQRVIPNKAYMALACGTPLITSDTAATRELLEDGRDALLVPPGDPDSLAGAIRRLASDDDLRRRIATAGRATYERRASEEVLGVRWRTLLEEQIGRCSGSTR